MSEWQPIETAPKGRPQPDYQEAPMILVYGRDVFGDGEVIAASYHWVDEDRGGAWRTAGGDHIYIVTHWMPLPSPPEVEE